MIHEKAPDQIVRVADSVRLDVVGTEEQARILDSAASQDVLACLDLDGLPVGSGDGQALARSTVRFEPNGSHRGV